MQNIQFPSEILEPSIVYYLFKKYDFFLKVIHHIANTKTSYFKDNKLQIIVNVLSVYYKKFNALPNAATMQYLLEKHPKLDDTILLYTQAIVKQIYDDTITDIIDFSVIEEETLQFIKNKRLHEALLLSQNDIEQQNYNAVSQRVQEAISVNFDKDLGVNFSSIDSIKNQLHTLQEEETIPTGFQKLDIVLNGGSRKKEMYVVGAQSGGYKTGFLGNIALNAFMQKKTVVVYTFEVSYARILLRYLSNMMNVTTKELLFNFPDYEDQANVVLQDPNYGTLYIKEYNANEKNSNDIMSHLSELELYENVKPDLVILDYLLLMTTNDTTLSSSDTYKYYKTVSEEIRNIAKTHNVSIWTASQMNREGLNDAGGSKPITTMKQISESAGIVHTSDAFFTLNITERDRKNNILKLYVDKNRNGEKGLTIPYLIDADHMRLQEQ